MAYILLLVLVIDAYPRGQLLSAPQPQCPALNPHRVGSNAPARSKEPMPLAPCAKFLFCHHLEIRFWLNQPEIQRQALASDQNAAELFKLLKAV